jgi:hypothetical protein
MNRTIPALAVLLVAAGCDRSDPPANQVAIDLNAATPAPEPTPAPIAPVAPAPPAANAAEPAAVAATMLPAAYHGVFDQTAAACSAASSIYRLTVTGKALRFHESLADVKSVTPDGANAVRVAASYSGEGMTWSNIQRVALSDGGQTLTITGEGEPVRRKRCS